jgi:hypothetical protein
MCGMHTRMEQPPTDSGNKIRCTQHGDTKSVHDRCADWCSGLGISDKTEALFGRRAPVSGLQDSSWGGPKEDLGA